MSKYNETDIKLFENKISMEEFKIKETSEESVTVDYMGRIWKDNNKNIVEKIISSIISMPFVIVVDIFIGIVTVIIGFFIILFNSPAIIKSLLPGKSKEEIAKMKLKYEEDKKKIEWLKKNKDKLSFNLEKFKKTYEEIFNSIRTNESISFIISFGKYEKELSILTKNFHAQLKKSFTDIELEIYLKRYDSLLNKIFVEQNNILKKYNNVNNLVDIKNCLDKINYIYTLSGDDKSDYLIFSWELSDQGILFDDFFEDDFIKKYCDNDRDKYYETYHHDIVKRTGADKIFNEIEKSFVFYKKFNDLIIKMLLEVYEENNKGNK